MMISSSCKLNSAEAYTAPSLGRGHPGSRASGLQVHEHILVSPQRPGQQKHALQIHRGLANSQTRSEKQNDQDGYVGFVENSHRRRFYLGNRSGIRRAHVSWMRVEGVTLAQGEMMLLHLLPLL